MQLPSQSQAFGGTGAGFCFVGSLQGLHKHTSSQSHGFAIGFIFGSLHGSHSHLIPQLHDLTQGSFFLAQGSPERFFLPRSSFFA